MSPAQFMTDPALSAFSADISHGFFTRRGGVSTGIYESLNCGLGTQDDKESVMENRRRAVAALDSDCRKLITLYQIHSSNCLTILDADSIPEWDTNKADAIVTNLPNIAIGIVTADCAPVLFYDPVKKAIGAAHAGWRGALNGIFDSTIMAMEKLGSKRSDIIASLGPCIAQPSYEVGPDYYRSFIEHNRLNEVFFQKSPKPDHYQFDLPGFVLSRLMNLKLAAVGHIAQDTYAKKDDFFSYRRTTHNAEPDYARQLSAIYLKN